MGVKDRYTTEEWATLVEAVSDAVVLVVGASPSLPVGWALELAACVRAMGNYVDKHQDNTLVSAIDLAFRTQKENAGQADDSEPAPQIPTTEEGCLEHLRQAMRILTARAEAQEASEYKEMLIFIAHQVAQAAKEGGFLGIGGERVSANEEAALESIQAALG